eukprot:s114_g23.t1
MAEAGQYQGLRMRHEAFQVFNDYLLQKTEKQGGTSAGTALHRLDDWDVPLLIGDGREPPDIQVDPGQDKFPSGPNMSTTQRKLRSQDLVMVEVLGMLRIQRQNLSRRQTPRGSASSSKKPTPPEEPPEWVNPVLPIGIDRKVPSGEGYKKTEYRALLLLSGVNFICSMSDGPHASRVSTTGWRQYLRRFVFYAATTFGIAAEGIVRTTMLADDDEEWHRLYHCTTGSVSVLCIGGVNVGNVGQSQI